MTDPSKTRKKPIVPVQQRSWTCCHLCVCEWHTRMHTRKHINITTNYFIYFEQMNKNLNMLINKRRQGGFHVAQTHLINPFCFIWSALLRFWAFLMMIYDEASVKQTDQTARRDRPLLKCRLRSKSADRYCLQPGLQGSLNLNESCSCVVESVQQKEKIWFTTRALPSSSCMCCCFDALWSSLPVKANLALQHWIKTSDQCNPLKCDWHGLLQW